MLFYITNSLIVKEGDERYKQIRKAIRNVLTGYSENKLLLMADFEVLEWMLLKFENDEDLISPIKYLYNNFSLLVVPDDICCYFEIVSGTVPESSRVEENHTIYSISYLVLQDSISTQKCALIGEDYNDCMFYSNVLKWYQQYVGQKVCCDFQYEPGNGGRMDAKIAEYAHQYRPAFALVDTDDKYEGQIHVEKTTRQKSESASKNHKCTFWLEVLPVHEVENLIPLNYIDKLNWNDTNRFKKRSLDYLRCNCHTEGILKYFDFKKGIHYRDVRADRSFCRLAERCFYLNKDLSDKQSFDEYLSKMSADSDVVYPEVRENTLSQILVLIRSEKDFVKKYPPELLNFQHDCWLSIGKLMLAWGCVRSKEALNV